MKIRFTIRRLVGPLLLSSLFFVGIFTTLIPQKAYAAGTYTFVDQNTISGSGQHFDGAASVNLTFKKSASLQGQYTANSTSGDIQTTWYISNINLQGNPPYSATLRAVSISGEASGDRTTSIRIGDPNGVMAGNNNGGGGPDQEKKEPIDCPIEPNAAGRWLFCDLLFIPLTKATNVLDSVLNDYLSTGNAIYEDADTKEKYRDAWEVFRNFGIGLLVIAGLVMLISEALSLSIIDAYTVRKVLPRLLVAIIGISVSWELSEFLIGFFDDLGAAMGNIIYTSFDIGVNGINVTEQVVAALLASGGITTVALTLGSFGILSLFGTLLLAMLVGAVVLILRQAIIVAAILLAPLAIAAYVLPNTNKFANFWWDTFIRMLMLYPIATGVIALAKVLGNITMDAPTSGSTLEGVISLITGMIFFIGGYALIPLAFRLTGGLVATIGGLANDRTRGGFDRLKNFRKGQTERNIRAMSEGRRFRNNSRYTGARLFNRASRGVATFAGTEGKIGFLTNRGTRAEAFAQRTMNLGAEFAKSSQGQAVMENDDALRAMTYRNAAEARAGMRASGADDNTINSAISAVQAAGGWSSARAQFAAKQMYATGTAYSGAEDAIRTADRVAGANTGAYADIVGYGNAVTASKGRFDLKGGFGEYMNQRDILRRTGNVDETRFYREAIEGNDAVSFLRGKPRAMQNIAPVVRTQLQQQQIIANTSRSATARESARYEAARYAGIIENFEQQGAMYASPNIKQTVGREMVRPTDGSPTELPFGRNIPAPRIGNRVEVRRQVDERRQEVGADGSIDEVDNPNYRRVSASGYNEQAPARRGAADDQIYGPNAREE